MAESMASMNELHDRVPPEFQALFRQLLRLLVDLVDELEVHDYDYAALTARQDVAPIIEEIALLADMHGPEKQQETER